jgi:hypothetical protein
MGWACVAVWAAAGCSSNDSKGGGAGGAGANPFGNVPGGSGTGGTGQASGTAGTNSTNTCAGGNVGISRVTPRVILVLDGSCSMSTNYPSNGRDANSCMRNPNGRWTALRNALVDPQSGVVTRLQSAVKFGVVVFGTAPMCPIPAAPIDAALNNLQAISTALPAVQPGMFTPTGAALDWVYANMFTATSGPDTSQGPQLVILATDGEPNSCGNATTNFQPSIDAVTASQAKNIKTYVISLASSSGQFHDHLQQLADIGNGGTGGKLYEPTTPADLATALQALAGGAVGCDVALNGTVTAGRECEGTVTLNGSKLVCKDPNGWILADPHHVRLQGTACNTLNTTKDALVDAHFPCGVFHVE